MATGAAGSAATAPAMNAPTVPAAMPGAAPGQAAPAEPPMAPAAAPEIDGGTSGPLADDDDAGV